MSDRTIEGSIRNAIEETTPDMLDQLEKELGIERTQLPAERQVIIPSAPKKRNRFYRRFAGIAAALVIFIGGYALISQQQNQVSAVVGLDVNPSIEMSIDKNDRVLDVTAVNEEGEEILKELDFEGSDISVAGNAIVGAMLSKGYLTDTSNSILVSVIGTDENKNRALEERLSADLNGYLENAEIAAAVLGEYVEADDSLEAFAEANGISEGKAWLIRELMAVDARLSEDSLLKLTTQDLVLLGQQKNVFNGSSYGTADTSKYISEEEAASIAMKQAGVTAADECRAEFEADDGMIIYEVEFRSGGVEYEYDIDAVTGQVIFHDAEADDAGDHDDDADDRDDDAYDPDDDSDYDDDADDDHDDDADDHDDDADDHDDDADDHDDTDDDDDD